MDIVPLAADHSLLPFECGEDEINRHLKNEARRHNQENIVATYVAVDPAEPTAVHGFYSLRVGELNNAAKPPGQKKLKGLVMPVVVVTNFATQKASQGRGIGKAMLFDLYRRAQLISLHAGCSAVCLQAISTDVIGFYTKYGMSQNGMDPRNLWISMLLIKELGLDALA